MVSEGGDLRSLGWKGRGVAFSDPASCRARARANSRCSCCAKMRRIESSLVGVSRTVYVTETWNVTHFVASGALPRLRMRKRFWYVRRLGATAASEGTLSRQ